MTLESFLKPEILWFIVGLVLLLLEFGMPGLILFFFAIGACIVAVVCLITEITLNTQLILFIAISFVLLFTLRKWLRGIFKGFVSVKQDACETLSEHVGKRALVTEPITPNMTGKIELNGTGWTAQASCEIAEGTPVEIIEQNNLTLIVKPLS